VAKIPAHCRDPVSTASSGCHFRDLKLHSEDKSSQNENMENKKVKRIELIKEDLGRYRTLDKLQRMARKLSRGWRS
jgi:hypothetical protein